MLLAQNMIKIWTLKPKMSTMTTKPAMQLYVCTIHYTYYKYPKYFKLACAAKTYLVYKECKLR